MLWRGARPDRKQELALEQPIEALLAELQTQPRALMRTGGILRRAFDKRLIGAERPATGAPLVVHGRVMALDFLSRKLVLLLEDEPLIALDIENHLRKAGARVVAAATLDAAWLIADHPHLSAAIVDLCLGAQSAIPICRRLANRNVPFVVHTGYDADAIEREWPAMPIMRKPANPIDVVHALAGVL
jgi:CheY-like chemotaxis protein